MCLDKIQKIEYGASKMWRGLVGILFYFKRMLLKVPEH